MQIFIVIFFFIRNRNCLPFASTRFCFWWGPYCSSSHRIVLWCVGLSFPVFDFSVSLTFIVKRNMIHLCEWWSIFILWYWVFVLCLLCPMSTWLSILNFDISISLTFIYKRDMMHLFEWWSLIALTYLYKSQCTSRSWSCLIFRIHYKSVLSSDGRQFISILSLK